MSTAVPERPESTTPSRGDDVSRETETDPTREPAAAPGTPTPGMTPASQAALASIGTLVVAFLVYIFGDMSQVIKDSIMTLVVIGVPWAAAQWTKRHTAEFVKKGNVFVGAGNDRGTPKTFVRPLRDPAKETKRPTRSSWRAPASGGYTGSRRTPASSPRRPASTAPSAVTPYSRWESVHEYRPGDGPVPRTRWVRKEGEVHEVTTPRDGETGDSITGSTTV